MQERRRVDGEWWIAIVLMMSLPHLLSAILIWCVYGMHPSHELYLRIEQTISWLLFFPGVLVNFVLLITAAMTITHRIGASDYPVFWLGILWWVPCWSCLRAALLPLISVM